MTSTLIRFQEIMSQSRIWLIMVVFLESAVAGQGV
jgi:hypothetical protein